MARTVLEMFYSPQSQSWTQGSPPVEDIRVGNLKRRVLHADLLGNAVAPHYLGRKLVAGEEVILWQPPDKLTVGKAWNGLGPIKVPFAILAGATVVAAGVAAAPAIASGGRAVGAGVSKVARRIGTLTTPDKVGAEIRAMQGADAASPSLLSLAGNLLPRGSAAASASGEADSLPVAGGVPGPAPGTSSAWLLAGAVGVVVLVLVAAR